MPVYIPDELYPTEDVYVRPYVPKIERVELEVVDIYKDPYFENQLEEAGVILQHKLMDGDQRELWRVQLASGVEVDKWLKKKEIVA